MIFAIGDIHGCAYELRALLNLLPLSPESTVVFLGDYIDRGPHSRDVVDTILELQSYCNVVTLMGNHESMFLDFLDDPGSERAGLFICNGGSATLASYADDCGNYDFPAEHLRFFRELRLSYEDEHHFFVHAGVPDVPLSEIDERVHKKKMLWIRGAFLKSEYPWSKVVVHGHTPVTQVDIRPNRINVDTGCVFMRHLSAIALPGYQIFSVPRQRVQRPVYLRDLRSRRVSIRFRGTLPVEVERGDRSLHFETVDYSEVGLYLRGHEEAELAADEPVRGRIGSNGTGSVFFAGRVVRVHRDGAGVYYAVQVSEMIPLDDAPLETRP